MSRVLFVGSGVSALTSALFLRAAGHEVVVFEAGAFAGGLASGVSFEDHVFDGGPYIVLDRPGLDWAFSRLGLDLKKLVPMRLIEKIYRVRASDSVVPIEFHHDLVATAAGFDQIERGAGARYVRYVHQMRERYDRLTPVQRQTHPVAGASWPERFAFLRTALGGKLWKDAGFLRGTLQDVLGVLPKFLWPGVAIWTRIAGQKFLTAPAPMALIPAIFHFEGSFLPEGGMRAVPEALYRRAVAAGVEFRFQSKVRGILTSASGAVNAVELADGTRVSADAVISTINGIATRLELLGEAGAAASQLASLPLQSPGFCVYLMCRGKRPEFYLNFRTDIEATQVFVSPESVTGGDHDEWPARLVQPLAHGSAEAENASMQEASRDRLLAEKWWQEGVSSYRVVGFRTTKNWGADFHLYKDSMNPAMTAAFMRQGRIPFRHPRVAGLFQAGSSTHPGQWVSFAAISGVLVGEICAGYLPVVGSEPTGSRRGGAPAADSSGIGHIGAADVKS